MIGVIVGRFQVPYLHPGHLHLIATALRENIKVIILLGVGPKDENNPYTIHERDIMISKIFPQVIIFPIQDTVSDERWSEMLDESIAMEVEDYLPFSEKYQDVKLYHSRNSFKEKYTGKYPLREVSEIEGYSGTKLRNNGTE